MSGDIQYLTREGLEKLKEELSHLKNRERRNIARQIADARDKGDLSENAEYKAALEAQGLLEERIGRLEESLHHSRVIDPATIDTSKVAIHSLIKLKDTATGESFTCRLVSENEADIKAGKISVSSPFGKGLLGKKKNERALIQTPSGVKKYKILSIAR